MRLSIAAKFGSAFGLILLVLLAVGIISYNSTKNLVAVAVQEAEVERMIDQLDLTLQMIVDAETGQRGFAITGDDAFLEPWWRAQEEIPELVDGIKASMRDMSDIQSQIKRMEQLITLKMAHVRQVILIRREQGLEPALQVIRGGQGKRIMDDLRSVIKRLKIYQRERFDTSLGKSREAGELTLRVVRYSSIGALLFTFVAATYLVRGVLDPITRLTKAAAKLAEGDLSYRVDVRSHDEMSVLAGKFNHMAAQLEERDAELKRSNAELEQFAYVASHDLQEPLRMVGSFTRLLSKRYSGKLDDTADQYINYAVDGATRMQTLINDLLTYSRAGRKSQAFAMDDLNKVVKRALQNLQIAIEEKKAEVRVETLPTLVCDGPQLTQVFQNLVGNALKFCKDRSPQIVISAEELPGEWKISVRDNGIGIEAKHKDRIFIIFQRLHDRTQYPGTGIGLAICKKIIERHGGRIWGESEPGEGTTFYFTLPQGLFTDTQIIRVGDSSESAAMTKRSG